MRMVVYIRVMDLLSLDIATACCNQILFSSAILYTIVVDGKLSMNLGSLMDNLTQKVVALI